MCQRDGLDQLNGYLARQRLDSHELGRHDAVLAGHGKQLERLVDHQQGEGLGRSGGVRRRRRVLGCRLDSLGFRGGRQLGCRLRSGRDRQVPAGEDEVRIRQVTAVRLRNPPRGLEDPWPRRDVGGRATGVANPEVSRVTVIEAQVSPWLASVARAAVTADVWAAPAVRAMDAARAASAAACWTLP